MYKGGTIKGSRASNRCNYTEIVIGTATTRIENFLGVTNKESN